MRLFNGFLAVFLAILVPGSLVQAAFHFMQIEQVIGGVNGDTTAQAIQLRMRSAGQNFVSMARLVVVDANGSNPIVLEDMTTNVANSQAGRRILLTTPSFANYTHISLVTNFTMDPIPASYLAAGQLKFMDDFGTTYWSLSWGGANYTGPTTGSTINDADGDFGPPVNIALPSTTLQALEFTGSAAALSTTNEAQYALTTGTATFINNDNMSFTLVAPELDLEGDYNGNDEIDAADYTVWRDALTAGSTSLLNDSTPGTVDESDFAYWRAHFGETLGNGAGAGTAAAVPEPATLSILLMATLAILSRQRGGFINSCIRDQFRERTK